MIMNIHSMGKLGRRLMSSILISALIIVPLVIVSIVCIRVTLNANIKSQQQLDSIEHSANQLIKALIDQETGQRGYNLTGDVTFLVPYSQGVNDFSNSSKALLHKTESFPGLRTDAKKIMKIGQAWHDRYGEDLVNLTEKGKQPSYPLLYEGRKAIDDFRDSMADFSRKIEEQRNHVRNSMKLRIKITLVALSFLIIGIIMVNLFITFTILKTIIQPIIELSSCVKFYTEHDFTKGIPVYRKKDELNELIQNIGVMRAELSSSIDMLKSKANVDELTGLYNRRHFNEYFDGACDHAMKLSLILLDIDFYKKYNDTYGHLAGDDCLRTIAACLQTFNDDPRNCVARYGGEEFAVLLLDRPEHVAQSIAEEIRKAILDLKIPHGSSPIHDYLTVSMGVATIIPDSGMTSNDLISLADDALYHSKQNGRNQVTNASEMVMTDWA